MTGSVANAGIGRPGCDYVYKSECSERKKTFISFHSLLYMFLWFSSISSSSLPKRWILSSNNFRSPVDHPRLPADITQLMCPAQATTSDVSEVAVMIDVRMATFNSLYCSSNTRNRRLHALWLTSKIRLLAPFLPLATTVYVNLVHLPHAHSISTSHLPMYHHRHPSGTLTLALPSPEPDRSEE